MVKNEILRNVKINKDIQLDLRSKYNPDGSTLRKAQLRMVEMLRYFDGICKENKLQYWLGSGTLLGAVRHGGFIPWDDDLDVVMMRTDAMKLKKILLNDKNNADFVLQCHNTDPFHYVFWDRIRDVKSANVSPSYVQDHLIYKGLAMDVFIMDDNIIDWVKQRCISFYHYMLLLPLGDCNGKWIKLRPYAPIFYKLMQNGILPLARLLSIFRHNDYITYSYGLPWKHKLPKSLVFPLTTIRFEGIEVMGPNKPENYLTILYGNWENIPSEKNIKTHETQFELYF